MEKLGPIAVDDTDERRGRQKFANQMTVTVEKMKQSSATVYLGKQRPIASIEPTPEGTIAFARQGVQQRKGHHLTGI